MKTAASDLSLSNIITDLVKMGFPTFDEFRKNPDKYRKKKDELLVSADQSTITFRDKLKRQRYFWRDQYECESLEQVERLCELEGYELQDLEMEPKARKLGGTGKHESVEIVIHFWPKLEFRMRGGIITNE